jgi:phosphoribosylformylglycinamidine synthase
MRNAALRFACKQTYLRVENNETPFTSLMERGKVVQIPISHGEGNYYASDDVLDRLEDNRQVVFRYCDREGNITPESNPNGSVRSIAGIVNEGRNVLGMMPHPDRCAEPLMGSSDGALMFESILNHFTAVEA